MNEQEQQALAEHLASLSYKKARAEIRRLDTEANLKYWRNAMRTNEYHTAYELPNIGLKVTLVEHAEKEPVPDIKRFGAQKNTITYIEARVEPLKK